MVHSDYHTHSKKTNYEKNNTIIRIMLDYSIM